MIACEEFVPDALVGGRNRFCGRCGRTRLLHDLAKKELPPPKVPELKVVQDDGVVPHIHVEGVPCPACDGYGAELFKKEDDDAV